MIYFKHKINYDALKLLLDDKTHDIKYYSSDNKNLIYGNNLTTIKNLKPTDFFNSSQNYYMIRTSEYGYACYSAPIGLKSKNINIILNQKEKLVNFI